MYLESSRTSKMEIFAKTVSAKSSILDVRLDSEYSSVYKQLECKAEDVLPATLLKKDPSKGVFL